MTNNIVLIGVQCDSCRGCHLLLLSQEISQPENNNNSNNNKRNASISIILFIIYFATYLKFRMADLGSGDSSGHHVPNPGGSGRGVLAGRRPSAAISPGRLPAMRSRDLTLGGVKKVTPLITRRMHTNRTPNLV